MQRCCRAGRRESALRCAWRGGCSAPGTRRRCRTRGPLRRCASSSSSPRSAGLVHHAHAASAAAEGRLDDEREADLLARASAPASRSVDRLFGAGQRPERRPFAPARGRRFCRPAVRAAPRCGPTKVMPAPLAGARQSRVLGKKSVAGMDRVHALFLAPARRCRRRPDRPAPGPCPRRSGRLRRP